MFDPREPHWFSAAYKGYFIPFIYNWAPAHLVKKNHCTSPNLLSHKSDIYIYSNLDRILIQKQVTTRNLTCFSSGIPMPYIYLYLPLLLGRWVRSKIQHSQFIIFFPVFYGTVFVDLAFLSMPSSQKSGNKQQILQPTQPPNLRQINRSSTSNEQRVGISKQPLSNLYNKLPSADMNFFTNWFMGIWKYWLMLHIPGIWLGRPISSPNKSSKSPGSVEQSFVKTSWTKLVPGDSKWPFYPLVGGHLAI